MSAFRCSACNGRGRITHYTSNRTWQWRCDRCSGFGGGWGPDAIFLAGCVVAATVYLWYSAGCPHSFALFLKAVRR